MGLRLCPSICELSSELSGRTQATRRELLPEPEEPVSRVSTSRLAAPCTPPHPLQLLPHLVVLA